MFSVFFTTASIDSYSFQLFRRACQNEKITFFVWRKTDLRARWPDIGEWGHEQVTCLMNIEQGDDTERNRMRAAIFFWLFQEPGAMTIKVHVEGFKMAEYMI